MKDIHPTVNENERMEVAQFIVLQIFKIIDANWDTCKEHLTRDFNVCEKDRAILSPHFLISIIAIFMSALEKKKEFNGIPIETLNKDIEEYISRIYEEEIYMLLMDSMSLIKNNISTFPNFQSKHPLPPINSIYEGMAIIFSDILEDYDLHMLWDKSTRSYNLFTANMLGMYIYNMAIYFIELLKKRNLM